MNSATCPICRSGTQAWASGTVLGDQPVEYARCSGCGAALAQDVTWLDRAYAAPIAATDVGLLDRCLVLSHVTAALLNALGTTQGTFLDWAGGYGALARLMRDRGYDFYDYDPMAANVFAGPHRLDTIAEQRFSAVTAYEVLEHLTDPVAQLTEVAASTETMIVTTQVLPHPPPKPGSWDYYSLETGQHVTFYTPDALEHLGQRLGYDHVVTGTIVHLFTRTKPSRRAAWLTKRHAAAYLLGLTMSVPQRRRSLLDSDHRAIKDSTRP